MDNPISQSSVSLKLAEIQKRCSELMEESDELQELTLVEADDTDDTLGDRRADNDLKRDDGDNRSARIDQDTLAFQNRGHRVPDLDPSKQRRDDRRPGHDDQTAEGRRERPIPLHDQPCRQRGADRRDRGTDGE